MFLVFTKFRLNVSTKFAFIGFNTYHYCLLGIAECLFLLIAYDNRSRVYQAFCLESKRYQAMGNHKTSFFQSLTKFTTMGLDEVLKFAVIFYSN